LYLISSGNSVISSYDGCFDLQPSREIKKQQQQAFADIDVTAKTASRPDPSAG